METARGTLSSPRCQLHYYLLNVQHIIHPAYLQVFLFATKKISHSAVPLIHEVIPIFDTITTVLDKFIDNKKINPSIRVAAYLGSLIMNKYYSLTDESTVYRIGMSKFFTMFDT